MLVGDDAMYGTDKLPKFAADSFETDISLDPFDYFDFKTAEHAKWAEKIGMKVSEAPSVIEKDVWHSLPDPQTRRWLIPTSEVSLTASVMGELLDESAPPDAPHRAHLVLSLRGRGRRGRDTRGFIRQHQFEKCELVSIVRPEDSEAEHDRMTRAAETVLETPEPALSQAAAVHQRHGVRRAQDL